MKRVSFLTILLAVISIIATLTIAEEFFQCGGVAKVVKKENGSLDLYLKLEKRLMLAPSGGLYFTGQDAPGSKTWIDTRPVRQEGQYFIVNFESWPGGFIEFAYRKGGEWADSSCSSEKYGAHFRYYLEKTTKVNIPNISHITSLLLGKSNKHFQCGGVAKVEKRESGGLDFYLKLEERLLLDPGELHFTAQDAPGSETWIDTRPVRQEGQYLVVNFENWPGGFIEFAYRKGGEWADSSCSSEKYGSHFRYYLAEEFFQCGVFAKVEKREDGSLDFYLKLEERLLLDPGGLYFIAQDAPGSITWIDTRPVRQEGHYLVVTFESWPGGFIEFAYRKGGEWADSSCSTEKYGAHFRYYLEFINNT